MSSAAVSGIAGVVHFKGEPDTTVMQEEIRDHPNLQPDDLVFEVEGEAGPPVDDTTGDKDTSGSDSDGSVDSSPDGPADGSGEASPEESGDDGESAATEESSEADDENAGSSESAEEESETEPEPEKDPENEPEDDPDEDEAEADEPIEESGEVADPESDPGEESATEKPEWPGNSDAKLQLREMWPGNLENASDLQLRLLEEKEELHLQLDLDHDKWSADQ